MVKFEQGEKWILRFLVMGEELSYTAIIISDDGIDIEFEDKFGDIVGYKKEMLKSWKKVKP